MFVTSISSGIIPYRSISSYPTLVSMSPEFQNLYFWKSKPISSFHLLVQILNMDVLKRPVTTYNCHTCNLHTVQSCPS